MKMSPFVLTSNINRAKSSGNVLLRKGKTNLPKPCVINISQIFTVDKSRLIEKIGALSSDLMNQILDGIKLLIEPRDIE